jgi:hypothetical protein
MQTGKRQTTNGDSNLRIPRSPFSLLHSPDHLTAVFHELGQHVGLNHDDRGGLFSETLPVTTRRLRLDPEDRLEGPRSDDGQPHQLDASLIDATFGDADIA